MSKKVLGKTGTKHNVSHVVKRGQRSSALTCMRLDAISALQHY